MRPRAVFVLGITGRSGTNFVQSIIAHHPMCHVVPNEDYFVDESDPLIEFRNRIARRWKVWEQERDADEMLGVITDALIDRMVAGKSTLPVTSTPSVRNLDRFFELFPSAALVVVVRDPRSVVASAVKTWGADGEAWARQWARRASTIDKALRRFDGTGRRSHLIRYEDAVNEPEESVRQLLDAIGLDPEPFRFDEIDQLPVVGSSDRALEGEMTWQGVPRAQTFAPMRRWDAWPAKDLARIEWLTRRHLRRFGYEPTQSTPSEFAILPRLQDGLLLGRIATRRLRRTWTRRSASVRTQSSGGA